MNQAVKEAMNDLPAAGDGQPPATVVKEATIEMPDGVFVRCPLVDFQLRAVAKHCPPCPHFRGLADRFPGMTSIAPAKRYFVLCAGAPTKRELIEVAD